MNEPSLDDQFLRPLWTFDTVNNKKVAPFSKVGKAQLEKFVTMPWRPRLRRSLCGYFSISVQ